VLEIPTVSTSDQITIPASIREKYDINVRDKFLVEASEEGLLLKKPIDFFSLEGCFSLGHIPDNEEELLTPKTGQLMEQE